MYFSLYSNEANYFSINDEKDVQKLWDQPPRNDSNDKKKKKNSIDESGFLSGSRNS